MQEIKINPEFASLLPPLTDEEFNGLEKDIIENGCRDALIVSNGYLIDGHNRYIICEKNHIEFSTIEMFFDSDDDVKIWIWKNQGNRRNISNLVKIELATKMKPILEERAKERQLTGLKRGDKSPVVEILPQRDYSKVRDELAEQAGVSGRTFDKGVYVLENADEETKDRLRRGEKGVSISGVYAKLKEKNSAIREVPSDEQSVVEPYVTAQKNDECPPSTTPRWEPSVTLNQISCVDPDPLVGAIFELFPEEYRIKFFFAFFDRFLYWQGKDETEKMFIQLAQTLT